MQPAGQDPLIGMIDNLLRFAGLEMIRAVAWSVVVAVFVWGYFAVRRGIK